MRDLVAAKCEMSSGADIDPGHLKQLVESYLDLPVNAVVDLPIVLPKGKCKVTVNYSACSPSCGPHNTAAYDDKLGPKKKIVLEQSYLQEALAIWKQELTDCNQKVTTTCVDLQNAIKQKRVTQLLLKNIREQLILEQASVTSSTEDKLRLTRMVHLIELSADMIAAGKTQDWALCTRMETSKRERVVQTFSASAIGWDYMTSAVYPKRPPTVVEDCVNPVVCTVGGCLGYHNPVVDATEMCAILSWLEDWRRSKSALSMANPLSYKALYTLQCDTQTQVASSTCTVENAEKLRVVLEGEAAFRGSDEPLDFPLGLCGTVRGMCDMLTQEPIDVSQGEQP